MMSEVMTVQRVSPAIAILTFATDEHPYLTCDTAAALATVVDELQRDRSLHAVILSGGRRYFSAGASEALLLHPDRATLVSYFAEVPRLLLSIPVPTIAAMAGHAVGGGLLVGLWCDLPLFAEECLYGANFMKIGFTPGMGSTAVLAEVVGPTLARDMLLTGRLFKGHELKSNGILAHAVVPQDDVLQRAMLRAHEFADVPRESLLLLKRSLAEPRRLRLDQAVEDERSMHEVVLNQEPIRQRIQEHFATFRVTRPRAKQV